MKFFLDESVPLSLLDVITKLGFEAEHTINIGLRGASDDKIAAYAKKHNAVLVTRDLEFGSIIFYPKGSHYGLLIIKLPNTLKSMKINSAVEKFLKSVNTEMLVNAIVVLQVGKYRRRIL